MQRVKPGEAGEVDLEDEQRKARLNLILNVAGFVTVVALIRVGKFASH